MRVGNQNRFHRPRGTTGAVDEGVVIRRLSVGVQGKSGSAWLGVVGEFVQRGDFPVGFVEGYDGDAAGEGGGCFREGEEGPVGDEEFGVGGLKTAGDVWGGKLFLDGD